MQRFRAALKTLIAVQLVVMLFSVAAGSAHAHDGDKEYITILVGGTDHRNPKYGFFKYMLEWIAWDVQRDACHQENTHQEIITYNPLWHADVASFGGPSIVEHICDKYAQIVNRYRPKDLNISFVGLGAGSFYLKKALSDPNCQLLNRDEDEYNVLYVHPERRGYQGEPNDQYPSEKWGPYSDLSPNSTLLNFFETTELAAIPHNDRCRQLRADGVMRSLGCGSETYVHYPGNAEFNPYENYGTDEFAPDHAANHRVREGVLGALAVYRANCIAPCPGEEGAPVPPQYTIICFSERGISIEEWFRQFSFEDDDLFSLPGLSNFPPVPTGQAVANPHRGVITPPVPATPRERDKGAQPECGNNVIETGEECDGSGCPTGFDCENCQCTKEPKCGDGIVDDGEECGEPGLFQCGERYIDCLLGWAKTECNRETCKCELADGVCPGDGPTDPFSGGFTSGFSGK